MFTARVPVFGLVEWTPEEVDDYASEILRAHQAQHLSIEWRGRWVFRLPFLVENACRLCAEPWPCPAAWWADGYQHSQARVITSSMQ